MFLGTYEPNLLEKGRIALPKKIREQAGGTRLVLTVGMEPCINGFSMNQWEESTRAVLAKPLFDDKDGRDQRRRIYAEAEEIELDSQGRCILPQRLRDYAGIYEAVIIMGVGDHFEIWDKKRWEAYRDGLATSGA